MSKPLMALDNPDRAQGRAVGVTVAPGVQLVSRRHSLRALDRREGILFGLVPVADFALEHVPLRARGRALDLLGVPCRLR